jgi:hypothetical protein
MLESTGPSLCRNHAEVELGQQKYYASRVTNRPTTWWFVCGIYFTSIAAISRYVVFHYTTTFTILQIKQPTHKNNEDSEFSGMLYYGNRSTFFLNRRPSGLTLYIIPHMATSNKVRNNTTHTRNATKIRMQIHTKFPATHERA